MHSLHSEKSRSTDRRKKALEAVEFCAVMTICIFMYFHERGGGMRPEPAALPALGDRIVFGTYLKEPIVWRVLRAETNGEVVLIAENILTMKAFDAADSGQFNEDDRENDYWSIHVTEADSDLELQAYVRGNSRWADSDIRAWLNSDRENVIYDGIGPVPSALAARKNGYADEPGFLNGFTDEEREAIVPTENLTKGNGLDGGEVRSTDLVYLLSKEELSWLAEADIGVRAKPTTQAVEQDQTTWYNIYSLEFGVDTFYWWLRDPVPDMASNCYFIDNGYSAKLLRSVPAGTEGIGVRPVVKVDTKKITLVRKEADSDMEEPNDQSDSAESAG